MDVENFRPAFGIRRRDENLAIKAPRTTQRRIDGIDPVGDAAQPVLGELAATYAKLGLPLRFPGKRGAYEAVYQVTDLPVNANVAVAPAERSTTYERPYALGARTCRQL